MYASYPFNSGEFSCSYFSGYDRTYNLSGVNVYGKGSDLSFTNIDILYGYRKTETYGFGGVLLSKLFNIRFDIGYFSTKDIIRTRIQLKLLLYPLLFFDQAS